MQLHVFDTGGLNMKNIMIQEKHKKSLGLKDILKVTILPTGKYC